MLKECNPAVSLVVHPHLCQVRGLEHAISLFLFTPTTSSSSSNGRDHCCLQSAFLIGPVYSFPNWPVGGSGVSFEAIAFKVESSFYLR